MKKFFLVLTSLITLNVAQAQTVYCPESTTCSAANLLNCTTFNQWKLNSQQSYVAEKGEFFLVKVVANQIDSKWHISCQYGVPHGAHLFYENDVNYRLSPDTTLNSYWYPTDYPSLTMCDMARGSEFPPIIGNDLCPLNKLA